MLMLVHNLYSLKYLNKMAEAGWEFLIEDGMITGLFKEGVDG